MSHVARDLPMKVPGLGQRARTVLDWLLDFAFGRNIAEFQIELSAAFCS